MSACQHSPPQVNSKDDKDKKEKKKPAKKDKKVTSLSYVCTEIDGCTY